jgi:large subunit ribosomal protein L32
LYRFFKYIVQCQIQSGDTPNKEKERRTHDSLSLPTIGTDKTTGENHLLHRAHWSEGALFYRGRKVIEAAVAKDADSTED